MPNDEKPTSEKPETAPAPEPAPAPAVAAAKVEEVIEPHNADGPIDKLMKLIADNHAETSKRLDLLEQKGKTKHETAEHTEAARQTTQEPAPAAPAAEPKPAAPRRTKIRLFRTL